MPEFRVKFWLAAKVKPAEAVIRPDMVGVAVQAVPVTVRFPPKEVKLLPETVKVLSKVVAPCKVRAPGVVEEPMVLTEEAPVPMVELPEEVKVVKEPAPPEIAPEPVEREAKVAAPAPVTDQLASFRAKSEPDEAPIVIVPPDELPMVVLAVPELLIKTVPAAVNPPVPWISPEPELTPTAVTAPAEET